MRATDDEEEDDDEDGEKSAKGLATNRDGYDDNGSDGTTRVSHTHLTLPTNRAPSYFVVARLTRNRILSHHTDRPH